MKPRLVKVIRKTRETNIEVELNLDGKGRFKINTGIGILNHMLELFTCHGQFDLKVKAKGDLEVDIHHTNEDIGIALGQALDKALGERRGIRRFGFFYIPMGEALVRVVLDISGRPSLYLDKEINLKIKQDYKLLDLKHFLESFIRAPGINLHIDILKGEDSHHILEAIFKALSCALKQAVQLSPGFLGIASTKGKL